MQREVPLYNQADLRAGKPPCYFASEAKFSSEVAD